MKASAIAIANAAVLGALVLASGCAHQYVYVPVGPAASGGPAARYPIPPQAPQGEAYVTSFGLSDLDVEPGRPSTFMHARLAVSNGSGVEWTVDGRAQTALAPGQPPQPPAFLNTDAGTGPIYVVPPGQARVFDLYYAMPPPYDRPESLAGFELDWNVNVAGQPVAQRTPFQRFEDAPRSYDPYPPYVTVGLGFGVGWWYGPYYHRPPLIRRYYYPPGRAIGGGWYGAPVGGGSGWRSVPPRSGGGWRGVPVAPPPRGGGWRPAPSGGGGGWRGAPPRGGGRGGGWRGR